MESNTTPTSASNRTHYGSEADVERITGRSRRTLQKDRLFGRGIPFYKFGRKVLYDLEEVASVVRAGRVCTKPLPCHGQGAS